MARARNIKPSLFKNELLGQADALLMILFVSLWCIADREGRLEDRPLRIKAETFPYREKIDVNGYLTELEQLGFISRYSVAGIAYIQVVNFSKHQAPHKTEKKSVIPKEIQENQNDVLVIVKPPLVNGKKTEVLPPDLLIPDLLIPEKKQRAAKRITKKPRKEFIVIIPEWLPLEQWEAYLEMRQRIRKPATPYAQGMAIAKLNELREQGDHPAAVLGQSIMNSWQGVFPVKHEGKA